MSDCARIRPLLYRIAEGEVSPDEAMAVARHTPDCTACGILLARERRLARMLEEELDDLPVGEDFVETVMSTLPDGPPPGAAEAKGPRARRRHWRGLKLACLFGGLLGTGLIVWLQSNMAGVGTRMVVAPPSLDRADMALQTLMGLVRFVMVTLETVAGGLSLDLPVLTAGVSWIVGLAGLFAITATTAAAVLIVAARSLTRPAL